MKTEKFEVGDIAIIVDSHHARFVGREVTILSPLRLIKTRQAVEPIYAHAIEIEGELGGSWCAPPRALRKRKPRREDQALVKWSDCIWQPITISPR